MGALTDRVKTRGQPRPKEQGKAKQQGKPKAKAKKPFNPKFRLPDGAQFSATYNAEGQTWLVTLTIGDTVLSRSDTSVHHSLRMLGQAWCKATKATASTEL